MYLHLLTFAIIFHNLGAALAGVRVIVQAGWSEISQEEFSNISKEAEKQARLSILLDEDEEESDENEVENSSNLKNLTTSEEENIHFDTPRKKRKETNTGTKTNKNEKTDIKNVHEVPLKSTILKIKSPWRACKDSLLIGSCPHSWLFGRVGAVVHHGGAGNIADVVMSIILYCLSSGLSLLCRIVGVEDIDSRV